MFEHLKKKKKFVWGLLSPPKTYQGLANFFLGLVDSRRNRLVSTAYQKKPGFSVFHAYVCNIKITKKIRVGNNDDAIIYFYVKCAKVQLGRTLKAPRKFSVEFVDLSLYDGI